MKSNFWFAIITVFNPDTKQMHYSYLTFYAVNRFIALKTIREQLPENPALLDNYGELRPYSVMLLKQIKESESSSALDFFLNIVESISSRAKPTYLRTS